MTTNKEGNAWNALCNHCKTFWYQTKGQSIEGVTHPPCGNQVRAVKRPPREYTATQQKAA